MVVLNEKQPKRNRNPDGLLREIRKVIEIEVCINREEIKNIKNTLFVKVKGRDVNKYFIQK